MTQHEIWSIAWCLALVTATVFYAFRLGRKSDYNAWETFLYIPTYLMGRLVWRVHFKNEAPDEIATGGVLVANHRSSVDPFFVQLAAKRRIHWMVAAEYCRHPVFGFLLKQFEVIPTNRSGVDTASTKQAISYAKRGSLVGMFPEGQLNHTKLPLLPVRSGAATVAEKAGQPIIPLHIEGSPYFRTVWSPVFMRGHVGITFGKPIWPQDEHAEDERTETPASSSASKADTADPAQANRQPTEQLAQSDRMILDWARQVVTLGGAPKFPVSLASRRKRRAGKRRRS